MGENTRATNATLGAAAAYVLIWLLEAFAHVDVPLAIEAAFVVIVTYGTGYLTPPSPSGWPRTSEASQAPRP